MTPKQAERRIAKAFKSAEVAYVAIEDVAREYPLPAELVQEAVEAMEAVIAFARDNTIGTISYQIVVDSDDGGPPLTLYLRIPKAEGQFRERREGIRQWWYTNWPEASKTVLLSVLPGRG